jgi:transposase
MTTEPKRKRQERSQELKARVLAECERPGASVAQVALSHGVNANLVHGWRRLERERRQAATDAVMAASTAAPMIETMPFLPVTVASSTSEATIDIELRRGPLTMKATWPLSAATHCATWVREILR